MTSTLNRFSIAAGNYPVLAYKLKRGIANFKEAANSRKKG
jgi:hypothetical protein